MFRGRQQAHQVCTDFLNSPDADDAHSLGQDEKGIQWASFCLHLCYLKVKCVILRRLRFLTYVPNGLCVLPLPRFPLNYGALKPENHVYLLLADVSNRHFS